jgi:hypothetical protein
MKLNPRFATIALVIIIAAMTRLLTAYFQLPNFSPITAMGIFGAAYFARPIWAFILPLGSMYVSDLILNNTIYARYFNGFAWQPEPSVYLAFALVIVFGLLAMRKVTTMRVIGASLTGSLLFFLITNYAVWAGGNMYPHNSAGLTACYVAAIPFLKNTLVSDLLFSAILFGAFAWAQKKYSALSIA